MRQNTINYHGAWPFLEPRGVGDAASCRGGRAPLSGGVRPASDEATQLYLEGASSNYALWKRWEDELGDRGEVVGMARLRAQINAAHGRIPADAVRDAILAWPKRLKACIRHGGAQFEHGMT